MADDLQSQFETAVAESKTLPERPDNMTMLKLYGLYKQASNGDAGSDAPDASDFVAKAKYDAWQALSGTSQDDARQKYIDLVEELKG